MTYIISAIISAVLLVTALNVPANIFSVKSLSPQTFGSFSQITSTDNLADFPTTYNANLNKTIEVGTTSVASITTLAGLTSASSLATIGTIISGIWNGTPIGVAYNGTGTTSPTSNQVMLGNGSSGFKVIGFGTTGQFLTSAGASTVPSWTTSAIDTTLDYNFTSSAFRVKNLHASSTAANPITLNGLSYSTPSVRAASSTVLQENGSGSLSWIPENPLVILSTASSTNFSGTATTTVTLTIPAGAMTTTSIANIKMIFTGTGASDTTSTKVQVGTGSASTTISNITGVLEAFTPYIFDLTIGNDNSLSSQYYLGIGTSTLAATYPKEISGTLTINTANQWYVSWAESSVNAAHEVVLRQRVIKIER